MIQTQVTRTLALAGLVPAGKPDYANRLQRSCRKAHKRPECPSAATPSPLRSGLLWLACALAAMGMAPPFAQTSYSKGANPWSGVTRDPAGNLYGTAQDGG